MSLINELNTYENIQSFKDALKSYVSYIEGTNNPDLVGGISSHLFEWEDLVIREFKSKGVDMNSKDSVVKAVNEIIKELEVSDYVELTMSFNPDPEFSSKIAKWIAENVSDNVSLLVRTDPTIGGGAKISFRGKFKDYSIEKKLRKYFNRLNNAN